MGEIVAWWDRHQVALNLAAIAAGILVGLTVPSLAHALELAINPISIESPMTV